MKSKVINCPQCGKQTVYGPENEYRPFCSERCKMIDLGHWAAEDYRIPDANDSPDTSEQED